MVGRKPKSKDPFADVNKRLDLLIAIHLANKGFEKKEISKILDVSDKTVQTMFAGKWTKLQKGEENG